jgi:formyl-CoA transferase
VDPGEQDVGADRGPAAPAGKALAGLRVLDLSLAEAGPVCAQWLAWFGADVVRVDPPPGPGVPLELLEIGLHLANNMNKRSVFLDYRQPEGLALLRRLVPRFDVVVENFRTGVAASYGLGYDDLRALKPALVYCSIKGYGTTGPYRDYPALDPVTQAAGGAMSITGEPDGPPIRTAYVGADHLSGSMAATAVLAAYVRMLRTGHGEYVELSMQEAVLSALRSMILIDSPDGRFMPRVGNRMGAPTDLYACPPFGANDYVQIAAPGDKLFDRLAIAIGQPELVTDERFDSVRLRNRNRGALREIVAKWTAQRSKWEAMRELAEAGVPASAVFDSDDLRANEHLRERGAWVEVTHPLRGTTEVVNNPARMASAVPLAAAPKYGEHTVEVLTAELGLDRPELERLEAHQIVDLRNVPD